jgi:hypothetical protein
MADLFEVKQDIIVTFKASVNQVQLKSQGMNIPAHANWPEPAHRKIITETTWGELRTWFLDAGPTGFEHTCDEARHYCARNEGWSYEAATSLSTPGVRDLKVTDTRNSVVAYNYHVQVFG